MAFPGGRGGGAGDGVAPVTTVTVVAGDTGAGAAGGVATGSCATETELGGSSGTGGIPDSGLPGSVLNRFRTSEGSPVTIWCSKADCDCELGTDFLKNRSHKSRRLGFGKWVGDIHIYGKNILCICAEFFGDAAAAREYDRRDRFLMVCLILHQLAPCFREDAREHELGRAPFVS